MGGAAIVLVLKYRFSIRRVPHSYQVIIQGGIGERGE